MRSSQPKHTMSLVMSPRHHLVHVPRQLRNKIAKAQRELAGQGVSVKLDVPVQVRARTVRYSYWNSFVFPWDTANHVWLVFTILQKAIGAWPKLREILINAGLTNDEITTLGLSKFTCKPTKRARKKKS
jgi:hypothetical protein